MTVVTSLSPSNKCGLNDTDVHALVFRAEGNSREQMHLLPIVFFNELVLVFGHLEVRGKKGDQIQRDLYSSLLLLLLFS